MSFLPNALNLIGLLPTAIICGAWWYAATQKRGAAIFYWLAATHTLALVIRTLQMISTMGGQPNIARIQSMGAASAVVGLALAGLYVALVRWLVNQPDHSGGN